MDHRQAFVSSPVELTKYSLFLRYCTSELSCTLINACLRTVNHLTPDTSGLVVSDSMTPNLLLAENPEHLSRDFLACFKVSSKSSHLGFFQDTLLHFAVLSEYVQAEKNRTVIVHFLKPFSQVLSSKYIWCWSLALYSPPFVSFFWICKVCSRVSLYIIIAPFWYNNQ